MSPLLLALYDADGVKVEETLPTPVHGRQVKFGGWY